MFKVMEKQCDQCLFGKNKIVSDARRKQVLSDCKRKDAHFVCHKGSLANQDICCRAFYDNFSTNLIRIAGRLKAIEFVQEPKP